MDLLAESEHYMVYGEYENVMMIIKASQKKYLSEIFMEILREHLLQKMKHIVLCGGVELLYII